MVIFKLVVVFAIVMGIVAMKKPMSFAVVVGSLVTWLLYRLPAKEVAVLTINALTSLSTLQLVLVMYLITFLQRMMEKRGAIEKARVSLSRLFNNRWVNCVAAPIFIGLLPSPNAAFIAGDMVKASAGEYLNDEQQAVTTTFFRHISEAFPPSSNSRFASDSLRFLTYSLRDIPVKKKNTFFKCSCDTLTFSIAFSITLPSQRFSSIQVITSFNCFSIFASCI